MIDPFCSWNPPLGLSFQNFHKEGGGSLDFSRKKGGVGKTGTCFKKGGVTYFHTK